MGKNYDGNMTNSYKPTMVAPIENEEIKAFGYIEPTYKAVDFDYNTIIGSGSTYDLLSDSYLLGATVINNNGDPTISELLDFKARGNTSVYSLGIELSDGEVNDGIYSQKIIKDKHDIVHEFDVSWSESVEDLLYTPQETITMTMEYSNNSQLLVELHALPNDIKNAGDFVENNGEILTRVYIDGAIVEEYTFDQEIARLNTNVHTQIQPGEKYKIETIYQMKDFKLFAEGRDAIKNLSLAFYTTHLRVSNGTNIGFPAHGYEVTGNSGPQLGTHSELFQKDQAEYVLKNLSDDGIEGSTYFDVNNVEELADSLINNLYTVLTDSIVDGVVTDPMSEHVEFMPGAIDGADVKLTGLTKGVNDPRLLEGVTTFFDPVTKTLVVDGLNLSANEKVLIEYQVQLLKDKEGFQFNTWYPTNGETTLLARDGSELEQFPIPNVMSVKDKVDEPEKPVNPIKPVKPEKSDNVEVPSKEEPKSPNTGIYTGYVNLMLTIAIASTVLYITRKKKVNTK